MGGGSSFPLLRAKSIPLFSEKVLTNQLWLWEWHSLGYNEDYRFSITSWTNLRHRESEHLIPILYKKYFLDVWSVLLVEGVSGRVCVEVTAGRPRGMVAALLCTGSGVIPTVGPIEVKLKLVRKGKVTNKQCQHLIIPLSNTYQYYLYYKP